MGCSTKAACHDCKIMSYLGYGSYRSMDERFKRFVGHEGHNTTTWIGDSEWGWENDVLYAMGSFGSRGEIILPARYAREDAVKDD